MKALLDACVLYPTLTRALLLTAARSGAIQPLWSAPILAEWRHAAARHGPVDIAAMEADAALMTSRFPDAEVALPEGLATTLHLPDPDDRHVLAAAIAGGADELVTFNLKDFPTRVLSAHGILRRDPDGLLSEALETGDAALEEAFRHEVDRAFAAAPPGATERGLMKRARLPKLGKRLYVSE